jgi:hypothetical protein
MSTCIKTDVVKTSLISHQTMIEGVMSREKCRHANTRVITLIASRGSIQASIICAIDTRATPVTYRIKFTTDVFLTYGSWLVNVICTIIIHVIIRSLLHNSFVRKGKSVKTPVKSVTLSLLTVNIVYFLFVTPMVMYDGYTVLFVTQRKSIFEIYSHLIESVILKFFFHINHVLNIVIYFLIGAKFRQESKEFLLSFKVFRMCHHKITLIK